MLLKAPDETQLICRSGAVTEPVRGPQVTAQGPNELHLHPVYPHGNALCSELAGLDGGRRPCSAPCCAQSACSPSCPLLTVWAKAEATGKKKALLKVCTGAGIQQIP